jgi:hypothetical protein
MLRRERRAIGPNHDGGFRRGRDGRQHAVAKIAVRLVSKLDGERALRDGVDVVIVPVEDGGYGLIGMRRAEPALFAGMIWGSDSVMPETRRRLTRLGLAWWEVARLWDVDVPADLERLTREGFGLPDEMTGVRWKP